MRGTNVHPVWWDPKTGPGPADRAAAMAAAGITHARLDVPWSRVEATSGTLHAGYMARLDAALAAFTGAGIVPLVVVTAAPSWASGRSDTEQAPPTANEPYVRFFTGLQRRWQGLVSEWAVWNEPTYPASWVGGTVRRYGELLKWTRTAAKNVDPGCTILGGSLHNTNDTRATDFLSTLLAAGYGPHMDVLEVHSYGDPPKRAFRMPWDVVNDVAAVIGPIAATGGLTCPVWLTEAGYSTATPGGWSPRKQAAAVDDIHRHAADPAAGIARCYTYEFFDGGTDPSNPEDRYGLVSPTSMRLKTAAA